LLVIIEEESNCLNRLIGEAIEMAQRMTTIRLLVARLHKEVRYILGPQLFAWITISLIYRASFYGISFASLFGIPHLNVHG